MSKVGFSRKEFISPEYFDDIRVVQYLTGLRGGGIAASFKIACHGNSFLINTAELDSRPGIERHVQILRNLQEEIEIHITEIQKAIREDNDA